MGSGCTGGAAAAVVGGIVLTEPTECPPGKITPIWLPYWDDELTQCLKVFTESPPKNAKDLADHIKTYAKLWNCRGLSQALKTYPEGRIDPEAYFFSKTLPFIVDEAFKLKERVEKHCPHGIPLLKVNKTSRCKLPRSVVTSIVAHMFLCTFDSEVSKRYSSMPSPSSCIKLLSGINGDGAKSGHAKLKMVIHYFERVMEDGELKGHVIIDRVVSPGLKHKQWMESKKPLIPIDIAPKNAGFEEAPGLAHVDFANKSLGGGVLTGGCVQEEIRFAICPELLCSLLVCPVMQDEEAIQIVGAEQFSAYEGYSYGMRYNGDHRDKTYPRDTDGTPLVCILAMDALNLKEALNLRSLKKDQAAPIKDQMKPYYTVRELNKALAAFQPVDADSLAKFPSIATGNWGCGAFKGEPSVKAVIQWAVASECGRQLKYFPFELGWGPILQNFSKDICAKGATVGDLMTAYWKVKEIIETFTHGETLFDAIHIVMKRDEEAAKNPKELAVDVAVDVMKKVT